MIQSTGMYAFQIFFERTDIYYKKAEFMWYALPMDSLPWLNGAGFETLNCRTGMSNYLFTHVLTL